MWAIWKAFTWNYGPGTSEPPSVFLARVKRLLALDRRDMPSQENGPCAFAENSYPGKGYDVAFTEFGAFYLAWALSMLDAGMKPADIIWLLRHIREEVNMQHKKIMTGKPIGLQAKRASKDGSLPSYKKKGIRIEDRRVFALIRKRELLEIFPILEESKPAFPIFDEPRFCNGVESLETELNKAESTFRHYHIFELARLAWNVREFLGRAPEMRRGRP